jgi:hypothetical protein
MSVPDELLCKICYSSGNKFLNSGETFIPAGNLFNFFMPVCPAFFTLIGQYAPPTPVGLTISCKNRENYIRCKRFQRKIEKITKKEYISKIQAYNLHIFLFINYNFNLLIINVVK